MNQHFPVMLKEVITSLHIKSNGIYVDLTLGHGGHSSAILQKINNGMLIAFDKDENAIKKSKSKLEKINNNFKIIHCDFRELKQKLTLLKIGKVDGILADLGVSSLQVDNASRGFSYNKNAKLDMRMNQKQQLDAYQIINSYKEQQLVQIFRDFADVMLPKRVAKGIIAKRPIVTTLELVKIIKDSLPGFILRKKNPAKAVFQAIRIAVNGEIDALKILLKNATKCLKKNGVLVIITFHSIEDRLVKNFFSKLTKNETGKLPIIFKQKFKTKIVKPSQEEIRQNWKSRSAKLRILIKLQE